MKNVISVVLLCASVFLMFFNSTENIKKRAIHADEAEQATTFLKLYDNGVYKYNPNGPHGPSLYYWANCAEKLTSNTPADKIEITQLRKYMLVWAVLCLMAFFVLWKDLKFATCASASAMFALTSLLQIYGSYFVQEIQFAFAVFLTCASTWAFLKNPTKKSAIVLGVCAGLAQICKETSVIAFVSVALSCGIFALCVRNYRKVFSKEIFKLALFACVGFAVVIVPFYSSFGTNWAGVADAFKSYFVHFADKSAMSEHSSSSMFYFKLLFLQKSGGVYFGELFFTLLAVLGSIIAFIKKNDAAKTVIFFEIVGLINIVILSVITYKTPWLILSPLMLLCVPAGYALSEILSLPKKWSITILILLCALYIPQFKITKNALLRFHSDPRNPFIYSHTVSDENNMLKRILECSKYSEYKSDMPIAFVGKVSPWPLPWQLRTFKNAGFWNSSPENINDFDVVICDVFSVNDVMKKLDKTKYTSDFFGLRKNTIMSVFIKKDIFEKIVNANE